MTLVKVLLKKFSQSDFRVVMRLLALLDGRDKVMIFVSLVIRLVLVALDILGLALVGIAVSLVSGVSISTESTTGQVIKHLHDWGFDNVYALFAFTALLFFIAKAALSLGLNKFVLERVAKIESKQSSELFARISAGNLDLLFGVNKADLSIGLINSFDMSVSKLTMSISIIFGEFVLVAGVSTYLALTNIQLFSALGLYLLLLTMILHLLVAKNTKRASQQIQAATIETNKTIFAFYDNFRQVKSLGVSNTFVERFTQTRAAISDGTARMSRLAVLPRYISEIGVMFGFALVILQRSVSGGVTVSAATIALFIAGGFRILASLLPLQGAFALLKQISGSSNLAIELSKIYEKRPAPPEGFIAERVSGPVNLVVSDLRYRYPGGEREALGPISFTLQPGDYVALIGPSGSGKSTLADLILGLRKPTEGRITIGALDVEEFVRKNPRAVAYVPQRCSIFEGTLAYNVCLITEPTPEEQERVHRVLELVGMADWAAQLDLGLLTHLSEDARGLSGGQAQRIGLARALYEQPRLLILDESTSALDAESESVVLEALKRMKGNTTIIAIAHRGNVVAEADYKLELRLGKVAPSSEK